MQPTKINASPNPQDHKPPNRQIAKSPDHQIARSPDHQITKASMMNMHLATTTAEVVARLTKDWDADTRAFDAVHDHILKMADALSDGIIKQFPEKFAAGSAKGL